jgi:hypothetical protein
MLNNLPIRSQEIILANMKQSVSLTLGILKSLYPRANFNVVGEGFIGTCINEEALKLIEDSVVTVGHIVDMLSADLSLGSWFFPSCRYTIMNVNFL